MIEGEPLTSTPCKAPIMWGRHRLCSATRGGIRLEILSMFSRTTANLTVSIRKRYVWICCLCVNQHRVVEMKRKGDFVTFEDLAKTFRSRVTGIGHILAMMAPWFAPTYLERLWCVYEMYMAHLHDCQITIGMPSSERENFVDGFVVKDSSEEGLVTKFFETLSAINVKNAKASVDADRSNILQLIQDGPGYEAFNVIVNQLIRNWAVNLVNDEVKVRTATLEKDSVYNGKDYLNVDKVGGEDEIIGVLDAMVFFQRVGLLYERMGELDKALALYEQVKEMIEKKLGPDHEIMVDPLLNIGKICRMQGKYEEALEYFNQMLVICERDYGPDHLTTGQAYTCTAQVYGDQGLHDKALQLYQRSLVIEERESGKNAISTAEILEHVAVELMNLGQDYEDALQKFHEVLSIKVDHYGKGTIYAALTMKNIASTLAASNRYEEAINTCQEALTIYEKVYGPDHPDTVALAALPGLIVTLKGL
uniref:Kinesin light chain n=1 Tax=Chaetoceros debilis TaxID=122233 RepID=A0A7S3QET1_9STRA